MSEHVDLGQIGATAQAVWNAWTEGALLEGLPSDTPMTLGDAYRVQYALDSSAGQRLGWKLAATGAGGRTALGVDQPLAGPLYERFRVPVGGSVEFGSLRMSTIEAEFGMRLGWDLPASSAPYDHETVRDAIDAFVPTIEFPNTRYIAHRTVGPVALTVDAALAGVYVLGEPVTDFDIDSLPEHQLVLRTPNGDIEGTGAKVLGDPVEAVRWLVNELAPHGYGLKAGEIVITGAAAATRDPGQGTVRADYGSLGEIALTLT